MPPPQGIRPFWRPYLLGMGAVDINQWWFLEPFHKWGVLGSHKFRFFGYQHPVILLWLAGVPFTKDKSPKKGIVLPSIILLIFFSTAISSV